MAQPESDIGKDRGDAGSTLEFAGDPFEPNGGSKADAMRPVRVEVSKVRDALVIARPKPCIFRLRDVLGGSLLTVETMVSPGRPLMP